MKNTETELCQRLQNVCEFNSDEDIDEFVDITSQLRGSKDPEVLRCMLRCFRDTDAGEVQYELVEACEEFSDELYVPIFLEEGLEFLARSPEWFSLMFQSILNTTSCVDQVVKNFSHLPVDAQNRYLKCVRKLNEETTHEYSDVLALLESIK